MTNESRSWVIVIETKTAVREGEGLAWGYQAVLLCSIKPPFAEFIDNASTICYLRIRFNPRLWFITIVHLVFVGYANMYKGGLEDWRSG